MHIRFPVALIAASVAFLPAQAHQTKKAIVVTGESITLNNWVHRTSGQLERNLQYPNYLMGREANEGVVKVRFACSDDGTPAAVTLAQSSGHHDLDNAAMRAVRGIRSLHPLPNGLAHDQQYQAIVLFAASQPSYDRQIAALRDEARQMASAGGASPSVAITLVQAAP